MTSVRSYSPWIVTEDNVNRFTRKKYAFRIHDYFVHVGYSVSVDWGDLGDILDNFRIVRLDEVFGMNIRFYDKGIKDWVSEDKD